MATNETLKDLNIDVNAKLDNTSEVKINMKKFFDETEVTTETEAALNPLLEDIKNDSKFDERLESIVNKSHVTALLEAMKAKLDSDGYKSVYQNYGHTITFAVQSALRIMWFNLPKENIDGEYGPETWDAVEAFQKWKWEPCEAWEDDQEAAAGGGRLPCLLFPHRTSNMI